MAYVKWLWCVRFQWYGNFSGTGTSVVRELQWYGNFSGAGTSDISEKEQPPSIDNKLQLRLSREKTTVGTTLSTKLHYPNVVCCVDSRTESCDMSGQQLFDFFVWYVFTR
jgi:hypothetical protein